MATTPEASNPFLSVLKSSSGGGLRQRLHEGLTMQVALHMQQLHENNLAQMQTTQHLHERTMQTTQHLQDRRMQRMQNVQESTMAEQNRAHESTMAEQNHGRVMEFMQAGIKAVHPGTEFAVKHGDASFKGIKRMPTPRAQQAPQAPQAPKPKGPQTRARP